MDRSTRLTVAAFPSAANAPLHLAYDRGWLADHGLDVSIVEVRSSVEQMALWESGACDVMHTSPDHLLRKRRGRAPVIARRDGFGELSVYRRADRHDLADVEWAVDGLDSGFAFVLRALLEDRCGLPRAKQKLRPIGGTKQRFEALVAGDTGGTTLHPPFDRLADDAGYARIAGHHELFPELITTVTTISRHDLGSASIGAYLDVLDRANSELVNGGEPVIAAVLEAHGLSSSVARAAATGLMGPSGLCEARRPTLAGLQPVVALRERFDPAWTQPVAVEDLLVAPAAG